MELSAPAAGVVVAVLTFLGTLAFQMGRLSSRVDQLEESTRAAAGDLKAIRSVVDRVDAVLQHNSAR